VVGFFFFLTYITHFESEAWAGEGRTRRKLLNDDDYDLYTICWFVFELGSGCTLVGFR
jgi:hypothetical protein